MVIKCHKEKGTGLYEWSCGPWVEGKRHKEGNKAGLRCR